MKNSLLLFLLIVLCWQCVLPFKDGGAKAYFIYDSGQKFKEIFLVNDTVQSSYYEFSILYPRYIDTFRVGTNSKQYILQHYIKYNNYEDTSFVKQQSYLDSIVYFDRAWLEQEKEIDSFWMPAACWRCGGIYDTVQIYLILPMANSDSLQFLQGHRRFYQREGGFQMLWKKRPTGTGL